MCLFWGYSERIPPQSLLKNSMNWNGSTPIFPNSTHPLTLDLARENQPCYLAEAWGGRVWETRECWRPRKIKKSKEEREPFKGRIHQASSSWGGTFSEGLNNELLPLSTPLLCYKRLRLLDMKSKPLVLLLCTVQEHLPESSVKEPFKHPSAIQNHWVYGRPPAHVPQTRDSI